MVQKDYYQILEIDEDASQQQIKEAYRRLALQYHPDRNKGNPAAIEKMKGINEAYAILSEPGKRSEYDTLRQKFGSFAYQRFRENYSDEDIFRGSDINQIFDELAKMFSGFRSADQIFREFYGPVYQTFEFRRPGFFGKGFVFFGSFGRGYGQRYRGGQRRFDRMEVPPVFPSFPLTGILNKLAKYALKKKWGIEVPEKGKNLYDVIYISPEIVQSGGKIKYFHRKKSENLMVKIPPHIAEGKQIRLKGMGERGSGGEEPGDLYLEILIRKPLTPKIGKFIEAVRNLVNIK